jgi:hypothetical protein
MDMVSIDRRNFLKLAAVIVIAVILGPKRIWRKIMDIVNPQTADDLKKLINEHGTGTLDLEGKTFVFGPDDEVEVNNKISIENGNLIRDPSADNTKTHPDEVDEEEKTERAEIAEVGPAALKITGPVSISRMDFQGFYEGIRIEGNGAIGTKVSNCTFGNNVASIVVEDVISKTRVPEGAVEISGESIASRL